MPWGKFLQDNDFKDACIHTMIEPITYNGKMLMHFATYIYDSSLKLSNHRKLAMDTLIHCRNQDSWTKESTTHPEFLLDVIAAMSTEMDRGVKVQNPKDYFDLSDTCKYRDHGSEKPCYDTKPALNF